MKIGSTTEFISGEGNPDDNLKGLPTSLYFNTIANDINDIIYIKGPGKWIRLSTASTETTMNIKKIIFDNVEEQMQIIDAISVGTNKSGKIITGAKQMLDDFTYVDFRAFWNITNQGSTGKCKIGCDDDGTYIHIGSDDKRTYKSISLHKNNLGGWFVNRNPTLFMIFKVCSLDYANSYEFGLVNSYEESDTNCIKIFNQQGSPTIFCGVSSNGDSTVIESPFKFEPSAIIRLYIQCFKGTVYFYINGILCCNFKSNLPIIQLQPFFKGINSSLPGHGHIVAKIYKVYLWQNGW